MNSETLALGLVAAIIQAGAPDGDRPAPGPQIAHHTAVVDGVRLHYVTAGEGEPVVLLHGWPQSWYEWRHVLPGLAGKHRVIAPDLRGMGDSDRPESGYDVRTLAADLHGILEHAGVAGPVHLVGHDLGGPVAYAYAATHPERVRRLAVIEAPLFGIEVPGIESEMGRYWHLGFHQARDISEALVAGRERTYIAWFFREHAHNPRAIGPADVAEFARGLEAPGGLRAGFAHYRAIPQSAAQIKELAGEKLRMPVLALGSEAVLKDLPLRLMGRVADDVRGGVIERCGHWVAEERPGELTDRLLSFFGEGRRR